MLTPEDAILDLAKNVVREPDKPPYNLGGWKENDDVEWKFVVLEKGLYKISLNYSRPGNVLPAKGLITVYDNEGFSKELEFKAQPTGKDSKDWSVYKINDSSSVQLEPGTMYLSICPDNAKDTGTDYFINLRSVTLTMEKNK